MNWPWRFDVSASEVTRMLPPNTGAGREQCGEVSSAGGKICRCGINCRGRMWRRFTENPYFIGVFVNGTVLAQDFRTSRVGRALRPQSELDHVACPRRRVIG